MSNKELDEILNEIKMHSQQENSAQESPASQDNISLKSEDDEKAQKSEPSFKIENDENDSADSLSDKSDGINFTIPESKSEEKPSNNDGFHSLSEIETSDINENQNTEDGDEFMSLSTNSNQYFEDDYQGGKKSKKPLIIAIAVVLIIALGAGIYFGFFHKKDDTVQTTKATETTQEEPVVINTKNNPLTGEADYNKAAIGKRPVAVVVENEYSTESVKPQWGMNEADIVLEGESEYSTRLLMFWADYTDMPAQIGPARSARPPFIRFSQLFDCIFIHAGLSRTRGNYIGANTVFKNEKIDHINLLAFGEDGTYFGRDKSRTQTIEHTGYFNGTSAPELIAKQNFNTDINSAKFTNLPFNSEPKELSDKPAKSAKFVWSDVNTSGHCPKVGSYYYDESTQKYSTNDFDSEFGQANLEFENLIFLLDTTEYIVKENYKGKGLTETYCDYKLSGGTGAVLSRGTAVDITWGVENGKLWMKDSSGKTVRLNPGKSYIGYGSSNKNGSITIE